MVYNNEAASFQLSFRLFFLSDIHRFFIIHFGSMYIVFFRFLYLGASAVSLWSAHSDWTCAASVCVLSEFVFFILFVYIISVQ